MGGRECEDGWPRYEDDGGCWGSITLVKPLPPPPPLKLILGQAGSREGRGVRQLTELLGVSGGARGQGGGGRSGWTQSREATTLFAVL